MAFDSICPHTERLESSWNIAILQAAGIKPVFQGGAPAAVPEHSAVPDTLKRRHFVIACAAARLEGEIGIRSDRDWENVVRFLGVGRLRKTDCQRELVACIKRRRVTPTATLAGKNRRATLGQGVEFVRIRR